MSCGRGGSPAQELRRGRVPHLGWSRSTIPTAFEGGVGRKARSITVGPDSNRLRKRPTAVFDDLEIDSLSLSEGSKDRALQRAGLKENFRAIVVADHDAGSSDRVVDLDDALHLSGFFDLAGAYAGRADAGPARIRAVADPDYLDIRQPATIVSLVGEANGLAVARLLAAHFATI
jgi:hypothetical protein